MSCPSAVGEVCCAWEGSTDTTDACLQSDKIYGKKASQGLLLPLLSRRSSLLRLAHATTHSTWCFQTVVNARYQRTLPYVWSRDGLLPCATSEWLRGRLDTRRWFYVRDQLSVTGRDCTNNRPPVSQTVHMSCAYMVICIIHTCDECSA